MLKRLTMLLVMAVVMVMIHASVNSEQAGNTDAGGLATIAEAIGTSPVEPRGDGRPRRPLPTSPPGLPRMPDNIERPDQAVTPVTGKRIR